MNWIDLIIIIVFGVYVWDGYRRGFLRLAWELLGIILAFAFALKFYPWLSDILLEAFRLAAGYSKPVAFLIIWFFTQIIFYLVGNLLSFYTPNYVKESAFNHYAGLIPAAIKGIIFVAVLLVLFMTVPLSGFVKNSINESYIGSYLSKQMVQIESQIETVFNPDLGSGLTAITTNSEEGSTSLNFSTTKINIDEEAETKMLEKVNKERKKNGLEPLQQDILIRNVARAHSRDMLLRGYFSHISLDGQTLFDRLVGAHADFQSAAENIALAPTIDLAHIGLMNSLKHKVNILDPSFTRVGIGVVDAGAYGLMVTQNFAN